MYWVVVILLLVVMIGVLAVSNGMASLNTAVAFNGLESYMVPLLLIIAIGLIIITQRRSLLSTTSSVKHDSSSLFSILAYGSIFIQYAVIFLLGVLLILGSGLQALFSYHQAEQSAVSQPMRVQALVTIEGISDSVYDATLESGYRQVAIVSQVSPLVSQLTSKDLDQSKAAYLASINNSLSDTHTGLYPDEPNIPKALGDQSDKDLSYRILLNAYPKKSSNPSLMNDLNTLKPGDQLFMALSISPLATSEQALKNPSGFDSYQWLRSRHIDGVATIITAGTPVEATSQLSAIADKASYLGRLRQRIDLWRWQFRAHFYQNWSGQTLEQQQAKAVTLSLLTGDRSLINRETKDLYQLAGISHLLAISGTHVLFLAIVLAGLLVKILDNKWPLLYRYIPRWQWRWGMMISAAFLYALFTGFDVPAARTAWMLLALGVVRLTLLPVSTLRVLLALAVIMAWFDPYVLWQAGYWLSFIAVALLLKYEEAVDAQPTTRDNSNQELDNSYAIGRLGRQLFRLFKRVFRLQCWLFIALLPVTLFLFGKSSLWGLIINLFAIGLFGWVIVPLNLLAGLTYLISPTLADAIWKLTTAIIATLHELIKALTSLGDAQGAWLYTPINTAIVLMALLSLIPWLLPRGFVNRWLAVPPLTLIAMTLYANQQSASLTPTLYVLPTGDRYVTATVLLYPVHNDQSSDAADLTSTTDSVSWLFLADHRGQQARDMPSSLTSDRLTATLEQQLRTLGIKNIQGIIVQTSAIALTNTLNETAKNAHTGSKEYRAVATSTLLPLTVAQLNKRIPVSAYWQAGRSDQWVTLQQQSQLRASDSDTSISAQACEPGHSWQLPMGQLTLEAMTGWNEVDDKSVWDCSVAINSQLPIRIVHYNATDPLHPQPVSRQDLTHSPTSMNQSKEMMSSTHRSRVIIDVATHPRVWQLWSLLCPTDSLTIDSTIQSVTWLGHSSSSIEAKALAAQRVETVMTYDDKPLEVALAMSDTP